MDLTFIHGCSKHSSIVSRLLEIKAKISKTVLQGMDSSTFLIPFERFKPAFDLKVDGSSSGLHGSVESSKYKHYSIVSLHSGGYW